MSAGSPIRTPKPRCLIATLLALAVGACSSIDGSMREAGAVLSNVDWPVYGGTPAGQRYSGLTQIQPDNVSRLSQVWRYDTGAGGLQTSPIVIGSTLYGYAADQSVIALDAATGAEKWHFSSGMVSFQPARGLTYWSQGNERRLFATSSYYLYALDPATGQPVEQFGDHGRIDLRQDLGRDPATVGVFLTSPGIVYQDLLITGFRTGEGVPAAPGQVRAFDVRTGKLRWRFRMIPEVGEPGSETWPQGASKTAGGANNWAGMTLDEARGIVYVPTGSAVPDFYGADRHGDNLFANSLIALDAASGRRLWHFQGVHHDLWDRDFPTPPSLLTVVHGGRHIDAVAQPSKQGFLFVFDRVTGKPLFPIVERPVAAGEIPGEQSAPTQPFPLKPAPLARQVLTEDMLTNRTPEARASVLGRFRQLRSEGPFTPFGTDRKTVVFPTYDGGAEWGGAAVDPARGILYINVNDVPSLGGLRVKEARLASSSGEALYGEHCASCHGAKREGTPPTVPALAGVEQRLARSQVGDIILGGKGRMPGFPQIAAGGREALMDFLFGVQTSRDPFAAYRNLPPAMLAEFRTLGGNQQAPYQFTGYEKFQDPDGYPAAVPPWGTLNAVDLNTGDLLWKVPLGQYPELAAAGLSDTGSENYGGPLLTASRLLFIGATIFDRKFRAFDAANGHLLWEAILPYAGNATPITYAVEGRQYVVIATSGARDTKGPQGSAYVAFALPQATVE